MSVDPNTVPPEASLRANRFARALARPIEKFLHVEASSGVILLLMAIIALVWANSPWASSYEHILHAPIAVGIGDFVFSKSVHFWINDILMVVFFFVVGLEVRRELHEGELSTPKRAALPAAAAVGGMVVPAGIYLIFNMGAASVGGWGTPMATDIAFAVGVLALLGNRVPAALRVLLLALAIIDDIGAILIIAVFYSSGMELAGFAVAGISIAVILGMQRVGMRRAVLYIAPGIALWAGILWAGIHPTIAGVILGLLTPVRSWFGRKGFLEVAEGVVDRLRKKKDGSSLHAELEELDLARREAEAPVSSIESTLHPWVAFAIMPLFALANAGVNLGGLDIGAGDSTIVILGISLGLLVGKPLGVLLFSLLVVKLGFASLPRGVTWAGVTVVGFVSGIGFTMALFIGALAFKDPALLGSAKLAVLVASLAAGILGLLVGFKFLPKRSPLSAEGAQSASEAESSTVD